MNQLDNKFTKNKPIIDQKIKYELTPSQNRTKIDDFFMS